MMQSPSRARHENSRLYHSHDDVWLRSKCRFRVEKKKRAVCRLENSCQTVSLNYRVITHSPSTHNRRRLLEEIWMNKERVKKKLCYTRRCFVRQRIGRMSEWEIGLSCCCWLGLYHANLKISPRLYGNNDFLWIWHYTMRKHRWFGAHTRARLDISLEHIFFFRKLIIDSKKKPATSTHKTQHFTVILTQQQELLGQSLLEVVFTRLNLLETSYFGLRFVDVEGQTVRRKRVDNSIKVIFLSVSFISYSTGWSPTRASRASSKTTKTSTSSTLRWSSMRSIRASSSKRLHAISSICSSNKMYCRAVCRSRSN